MGFTILWVLFAAWAMTCLYYIYKINRVARGKGVSAFSLLDRSYKGSYSRTKTRRLFLNIVIATIIFIVTVFIAYFVRSSS